MHEELENDGKKTFNIGDVVRVLNSPSLPSDYQKTIGKVGEVIGFRDSDWLELKFYEDVTVAGAPLFVADELELVPFEPIEPLDDVNVLFY